LPEIILACNIKPEINSIAAFRIATGQREGANIQNLDYIFQQFLPCVSFLNSSKISKHLRIKFVKTIYKRKSVWPIYFNLNTTITDEECCRNQEILLILYPHKQQLNIIYTSKKPI